MARTEIELYEAVPVALAANIDEFCAMSDEGANAEKEWAYQLVYETHSADAPRPKIRAGRAWRWLTYL